MISTCLIIFIYMDLTLFQDDVRAQQGQRELKVDGNVKATHCSTLQAATLFSALFHELRGQLHYPLLPRAYKGIRRIQANWLGTVWKIDREINITRREIRQLCVLITCWMLAHNNIFANLIPVLNTKKALIYSQQSYFSFFTQG